MRAGAKADKRADTRTDKRADRSGAQARGSKGTRAAEAASREAADKPRGARKDPSSKGTRAIKTGQRGAKSAAQRARRDALAGPRRTRAGAEQPDGPRGQFSARVAVRDDVSGSKPAAPRARFASRANSRNGGPADESAAPRGRFTPRASTREGAQADKPGARRGKFAPRSGARDDAPRKPLASGVGPRGARANAKGVRGAARHASGARHGELVPSASQERAETRRGKGARGERTRQKPGARSRPESALHEARGEDPRGLEDAGRERAERPARPFTKVRTPYVPIVPKVVERKRPDLSSEPHPGHFLLTTREGSEQDLVDELMLLGILDPPPRVFAPSLVLAPKVPKLERRPVDLTFARQGFPIVQSVHAHDVAEIAARVGRSLRGQLEKAKTYGLHVWVPDSTLGNPLAAMAEELEAKVAAYLAEQLPEAKRVEDSALRRLGSILFAQVCLIDTERAVAGVTYSNAAISLARGGRTRVRVTGHFPSRAARKLEEAFAWLGVEPGPGELCVDLGAAPGGWTYVLADRRARVIAVDPAKLKPEILAMKGVRHLQESAFTYTPDSEIDWLLCDMAWRPLEAAALLAKWGRKRWARMLVANIKLPMTRKAEMVARVRHILSTEGDWKHIRVKQLYHDRDEITLSAHTG